METLRYVLLANGLLMVVSIAFYGLLRRETFFQTNRLMLWLGVLSVLILPALQFPDWRPQRVRSAMQHTARVIAPKVLPQAPLPPPVTITFPNGRAYPVTTIRRLARLGWSWQLALIGAYLTGLLILTGRFVVQLLSIRRLIRRSTRESLDDFTLVTNPAVDAPFSFLNWVVINPARHSGDELDQVLRHERVHVRQRHSLDMLMAEAVCIVFWLNPAAYLFRRLVHQTLEFCADQAVLAEGVDARTYQYNLLKVSLSAGPLPITNSFSTSQLRDRIRMMNRQRPRWFQALRYPVVLILCLTIVTAFARHKAGKLAEQIAVPAIHSLHVLLPAKVTKISTVQPTKPLSLTIPTQRKASTSMPLHAVVQLPRDTIADLRSVAPYPERRSESRLVAYEDDILYWIITPKTTLEDINELRRELAKHAVKLQLRQIKYDPSYSFIDQINVSVTDGPSSTNVEDLDDDNGKPLKSAAGYCDIGIWKDGQKPHLSGKPIRIPESLRLIARADEVVVDEIINRWSKENAISAGQSKFHQLGSGSTRFDRAFFVNKSTKASGVVVNSDKSLTVDDACKAAAVYINNELVDSGAVGMWTVDKLYAVIKKTRYDPVTKQATPVALLLYTIDN